MTDNTKTFVLSYQDFIEMLCYGLGTPREGVKALNIEDVDRPLQADSLLLSLTPPQLKITVEYFDPLTLDQARLDESTLG